MKKKIRDVDHPPVRVVFVSESVMYSALQSIFFLRSEEILRAFHPP